MISTLILILFVGINIGLARYDAYRIKNNLRIRHAVNSVVYILLMMLFIKWLTATKVLGLLLIRIPVFNTALNIFRGRAASHLSKTTTSIIDQKMNKHIQKVGYWYYNSLLILVAIILLYI